MRPRAARQRARRCAKSETKGGDVMPRRFRPGLLFSTLQISPILQILTLLSLATAGCIVSSPSRTSPPPNGAPSNGSTSNVDGASGNPDAPDQSPTDADVLIKGDHNLRPYEAAPPPDSSPAVQMINDRACQLLKMGPFAPVMGQADFSYQSPPINTDAQAYRVQIPRSQAHVSFIAPAAGEYVFYTAPALPITVFSLDGSLIDVKSLVNIIPECAEVKLRQSFVLKKEPYIVRFGVNGGPTVVGGSVTVVVVAAPPGP